MSFVLIQHANVAEAPNLPVSTVAVNALELPPSEYPNDLPTSVIFAYGADAAVVLTTFFAMSRNETAPFVA